jgi:hypothetical protein
MGRPKIYKTEAERRRAQELAKKKHNSDRRERYRSDSKYRKEVLGANLKKYRDMVGMEFRKAEPSMVSIVSVQDDVFDARTDKPAGRRLCVDYDNMAILLGGYHKYVLHRWHRSDRFPRANHYVKYGSHRKAVYLNQEAKKLATILRDHQSTKQYLSNRDVKTINRLFAVMA